MLRLPKIITKTLSIRLSIMVVVAMAVLLMATMVVMLVYSRRAVKEEALNKASQSLEGTVQRIDNLLLSVEQTTGNFYFSLIHHLDDQEAMLTYSRELVESNPYVAGCAIAFKADYYHEGENFMAYYRREGDSVVRRESFGDRSYTEQVWFTKPMASATPAWMNPLEGMEVGEEPIITFCLPIPAEASIREPNDGRPIGVIGVDVSLSLLTRIVLETKPSANSYCTLLAEDGSFIVHPDSTKLFNETVFTQLERPDTDPSVREAAEAMVSGQTGYKPFRLNGTDYYVFFKPFRRDAISVRATEEVGWSAGIIYPEDDIFGDYNNLLHYVLIIAGAGLLLLFVLSCLIIHRRLKPLQMLSEKAQLIAQGHYDETIPDSNQHDEIGRLQNIFQQMQKTLAMHIGELEQLTATLRERGEGLREALSQAQKADKMKTAFLHNMTNQMVAPSEAIVRDVSELKRQHESIALVADDIQQNGNAIAEVLDNLISMSDEDLAVRDKDSHSPDEDSRKEVAHE